MNFDEIASIEDLLTYWELVFSMWKKTPQIYTKLLSYVGESFKTSFEDYTPIHLVGDYRNTANKLLVLSLHPSATMKSKYIKFEHKQRKFRAIPTERTQVEWTNQITFATKYFTLLRENNQSILFFTNLEKLIRKYEETSESMEPKYELLQERIINVDILPFYSKKVVIKEMNPVLKGSLARITKFYVENEFETMVINGKMLFDGLLNAGFVRKNKKEAIPIQVQGKELKIEQFELEYNGLTKKGIAIPSINNLSDDQKKKVAEEMRKATAWNKKHSCDVILGQYQE